MNLEYLQVVSSIRSAFPPDSRFSFHWTPALHLLVMQEETVDLTDRQETFSAEIFLPETRLPFIVESDPGPEGSIHHVSIASIPDKGEVTDPALLAPECGAAVVDPGSRGGVDPSPGIEVNEVLLLPFSVSRSVPVYGGSPA